MFVLQHVGITFPPGEADAIRAFYGEGLGMTEMPLPPEVAHLEWVWFATDHDGVELHFISSSLPPDPTRAHHFCLQVDDLTATRRRLEEIGAPVSEAGARLVGRERVFTRDPVGNLVEILEMTDPAGGSG